MEASMRTTRTLILGAVTLLACTATTFGGPALETDEQKIFYALGYALSRGVGPAQFTAEETSVIVAGLQDGLQRKEAEVAMDTWSPKIQEMLEKRLTAAAEVEKVESVAFCDAEKQKDGAEVTTSGAIYFELEPGTGAQPGKTDKVKLHYHGTLRDGTVFDSSVKRGEPATFAVNGVVPCFSEGVQKMKVGGKARLVCPAETAYGERGSPPSIPPSAAITFEVELLEIIDSSATKAAPVP
jgi:FKBP-type peptidyl-prolyl cis-trans isomerase